jgi:hypothetical protein
MILRRLVISVILAVFAVLHAHGAWRWLDGWPAVCSTVFAGGYLFAIWTLWRGYFWARWFVQGIAVVGALNCAAVAWLWGAWKVAPSSEEVWAIGIQGGAFVALLILLAGRSMAARFDRQPSPHNRWDLDAGPVRLLRVALVVNFAALPMLLLYLGNQGGWVTPTTRWVTGAVLLVLTAALALLILQRTAGLLLLGLAGVGTIWIAAGAATGIDAMLATSMRGWCGYAVGQHHFQLINTAMVASAVLPGALAAVAALVAFVAPMIRFLRGTASR